jgi:ElaB/YqjD/DUF883 family membrane-anchored ribosome-binding protein
MGRESRPMRLAGTAASWLPGSSCNMSLLSDKYRLQKGSAMNHPEQGTRSQERLIGDLRQVIENAEELLRNTDKYTSSLYQSARARLELALVAATAELARFEEEQVTRMMDATLAANALYRDQTGEARLLRAFE